MRISRVQISNFANFQSLDLVTGNSLVIVGENKVGKSNLIRALQLILDPSLSERDRHLGLEHFWDGLGESKLGSIVEVSVQLVSLNSIRVTNSCTARTKKATTTTRKATISTIT